MYRKAIKRIRFWSDIFLLSIGFVLTVFSVKESYSLTLLDGGLLVFLITGWYFSTKSNNLYDEFRGVKGLGYELLRTFNNIAFQGVLTVLFLFVISQPFYDRKFALLYLFWLSILLPVEKFTYKRIFMYLRNKGRNLRNVLIVGAGKVGMDFYEVLVNNPYYGYQVLGFLDDENKAYLNGQYLGTIEQLERIFARGDKQIDEVIVALPNNAVQKIKEVVQIAMKETVRVRIIPDYFNFLSSKYNVDMFGNFPIITVRHEPLEEFHWKTVKRVVDIVMSLLILVMICSWLFPIIALLIKLDSRGPVFFVQERWGKQNKKMKCYKFRSMYTNNGTRKKQKFEQAKRNDPRVTRIGAFLRKTSLDEMPQFFNVLIGSMSVVGPRPHPTPLNIESRNIIDSYQVRHLVKPGITGWAQVNGLRGETAEPEMMQARVAFDIWYIENWSLELDIKIIFLTAWRMLIGDKNAF
ncbi:undecaprenyl-phosphate glucose phosphotransferase [Hufsiella ginkgonis]|uniref:Undecaprenyl-phosphate glucose phosphotransferase n=1 Tax=Hufsiella ginkgonis TaxID=2695274 RepID=A0A7K1Y3W7_9SPHI|nr:undecaprenyl-phosphate glucose phosphotransferase [Hufsiella ginkgonis]MXV17386.1 undecaprenyl-phosphate glucose phosphotransferase [Hufsiella ginkgonis]